MSRLAVFDFDGTITRIDTFVDFVRFTKGTSVMLMGMLIHLPRLLLMKVGLVDNGKVKEKVFSWFFRGTTIEEFNGWSLLFYSERAGSILRKDAIECITRHRQKGDTIAIVSASIDNWVRPFAAFLNADVIICTQIEVSNGLLTGRFSSPNCSGKEKVTRLEKWIKQTGRGEPISYIFAYGDSKGDAEILSIADESHYKVFKQ